MLAGRSGNKQRPSYDKTTKSRTPATAAWLLSEFSVMFSIFGVLLILFGVLVLVYPSLVPFMVGSAFIMLGLAVAGAGARMRSSVTYRRLDGSWRGPGESA